MKVSAILMSRILAFMDTADLRPTGGLHAPEFVEAMVAQFGFQKFPQTVEELDVDKGIEFLIGKIGKRAITKLVIWPSIIVLEARLNTTECKDALSEMLAWATDKFKLNYTPEMIARYGYVSDIGFSSKAPLLEVSSPFARIAERTGKALSEIWNEPITCELSDFKIGIDPLTRQWGIAPFQIARRAQHKFSEGKYFSEAPLPTDLHIELLQEYEAGILALRENLRGR